jgi:hypothetical protein
VNARELLDANGHATPFEGVAATITREQVAPEAFAALRKVLELHKPVSWFTECMDHSRGEGADHGVEHFYVGADGDVWACEDTREPNVCQECTPEYADDDEHPPVPHPCATVLAITEKLKESA